MELHSIGLAGVESAQRQIETHARRIAQPVAPLPVSSGPVTGPPADTIELSAEIVGLLAAQNTFEASLAVIQTADQVDQAILDLLA